MKPTKSNNDSLRSIRKKTQIPQILFKEFAVFYYT